MTLYAGEVFRITAEGADFDGTELTEANVNGVAVRIYNSAKEEIVDTDMDWDADEGIWVYLWNTALLPAGSYRYQIIFEGVDGNLSWEWKRVRINKNPIVPV